MKQQEISQVHAGLNCFREGVREIPIESIPGLKLSGWRSSQGYGTKRAVEETCDQEQLYQALRTILNQVNQFELTYDKFNSIYIYYIKLVHYVKLFVD